MCTVEHLLFTWKAFPFCVLPHSISRPGHFPTDLTGKRKVNVCEAHHGAPLMSSDGIHGCNLVVELLVVELLSPDRDCLPGLTVSNDNGPDWLDNVITDQAVPKGQDSADEFNKEMSPLQRYIITHSRLFRDESSHQSCSMRTFSWRSEPHEIHFGECACGKVEGGRALLKQMIWKLSHIKDMVLRNLAWVSTWGG